MKPIDLRTTLSSEEEVYLTILAALHTLSPSIKTVTVLGAMQLLQHQLLTNALPAAKPTTTNDKNN